MADFDIEYKQGWHDNTKPYENFGYGLTEDIVRKISARKQEPAWMLQKRLKGLELFLEKPMIRWGDSQLLNALDFDTIQYYVNPIKKAGRSWEDVPENIKNSFERLGIPEAERKYFAGVGAQYDSEVVYHGLRQELQDKGVIFLSMDEGLKQYPDRVKQYFGKIIPPHDNKFAALNTAVWSGGSFVYVPKDVQLNDFPLQAYFRINAKNAGQFERTLIIAEPGSKVHYIEGCTAPVYSENALHSAVVELIAKKDSHLRYTTVQNWSNDVYNLVTKRAHAYEGALVEWVDGNIGSKLTMKYPSVYLLGKGARGEVLSVAYAGNGQHQDTGAKMIHLAPNTSSRIIAKSISKGTGKTTYRGLVRVERSADNVKSSVQCDALLLNDYSQSDTFPIMEIDNENAQISHEATVGKIGDDELFYVQTRGIPENEALSLLVNGFFEPFSKQLPMDYAIELNRLIEHEMKGAIG
ncbi:Fe-S cluster assembly protein SufB [archaeon CG10_big_fil_rev_8_21_14_0_10_43_11]|nr:MAG: Fe-S cluster assembly protein SufB [archaeon CG10_big_fil_rev_8_21_14_0_10_43_11]